MYKISIAIPCYEMNGVGVEMLKRALDSLNMQNFQDFEVVVSDNSDDDKIYSLCKHYVGLKIKYIFSLTKGMAPNTNEAIRNCSGELIKILYQDDYLAHPDALKNIVEAFDDNCHWLVTACSNNVNPHYTQDVHLGNNRLGSPSVLTIRNREENQLFFDESMTWLLDCDYYKRLYDRYGLPKILDDAGVVIGLHENQATHLMGEKIKRNEHDYMSKKYESMS